MPSAWVLPNICPWNQMHFWLLGLFLFPEPIWFPKTPLWHPPPALAVSLWPAVTHAFTAGIHHPPPHLRPWPPHSDQHDCPSSPFPAESTACPFNSTDYNTQIDRTNTVSHNWYWLVPPAVIMAALLCPMCASGFLCLSVQLGDSNEREALNSSSKI